MLLSIAFGIAILLEAKYCNTQKQYLFKQIGPTTCMLQTYDSK